MKAYFHPHVRRLILRNELRTCWILWPEPASVIDFWSSTCTHTHTHIHGCMCVYVCVYIRLKLNSILSRVENKRVCIVRDCWWLKSGTGSEPGPSLTHLGTLLARRKIIWVLKHDTYYIGRKIIAHYDLQIKIPVSQLIIGSCCRLF